jgi:hypothetical protein
MFDIWQKFEKRCPKPNLDERAQKELGFTPKELKELQAFAFPYYDSKEGIEVEEINEKIMAAASKKFDMDSKGWVNEFRSLCRASKNPRVRAREEVFDKEAQWNQWWDNQPEAITWTKKRDEEESKIRAKNSKRSFCGLGLNKPGTLVEVKIGKKTSQYLIGHINELLGVCDDCTAFDGKRATVLKYKVIWKETTK